MVSRANGRKSLLNFKLFCFMFQNYGANPFECLLASQVVGFHDGGADILFGEYFEHEVCVFYCMASLAGSCQGLLCAMLLSVMVCHHFDGSPGFVMCSCCSVVGSRIVHVLWTNKSACLFVEGNCQILDLRSRSKMFV